MKDDKNKTIREPYEPDDTPTPPQIIEPNSERERENPVEDKDRPDERKKKPETDSRKPHLLSEDSDIDDETTI